MALELLVKHKSIKNIMKTSRYRNGVKVDIFDMLNAKTTTVFFPFVEDTNHELRHPPNIEGDKVLLESFLSMQRP